MIARNEELRILTGEEAKTAAELVGYVLHDPLGQKIGKVETVFSNGTGEPEYIRVRIGGLFDRRSVLLPVETVAVDEERRTLVLR